MSAPANFLSIGKLGIIAGGGDLPLALAEHCAATGHEYFVARVAPFADSSLDAHPGESHDLGAMGARVDALKRAGCVALVFVGRVPRPDFSQLLFDEGGKAMLTRLRAAAPQGDDALLRALVDAHADAGFRVVGADQVMAQLLAPAGALGAFSPNESDHADMRRAASIVAALGALDVGQAAVVRAGLALAVEAQEGTDAMLERTARLPDALRGAPGERRGVLVKRPKPGQERRVDLPVIGERTIELAAAAGLSGIGVEAGAALIVRREATIAAADEAGLFVFGFVADGNGGALRGP